ncbi:MAG: Fic family protein [Pseudomonadota bacterium]
MVHLKFMEGLAATQQQELLNRLKVEWTYTSNALEGNTLSLGDTQFLIEYGLTIKGKSIREHNEVIGHARAVDLVYELRSKDRLEKQDIFNLHQQTQVVVDIYSPIGNWKNEANGRYVKTEETLVYLAYPKPEDVEHLMQLWLIDFNAQNQLRNDQQAIDAYTRLHLALIHPFFDGNGRMARLLANIPLLKSGFLPIVVNNQDRQDYLQALSKYELSVPALNRKTTRLVKENLAFEKLKNFFEQQYDNTKKLVSEIKLKK